MINTDCVKVFDMKQVWNKVLSQVWGQVRDQVCNHQVRQQVWKGVNQVRHKVWDQCLND